jgi:predicted exporter
MNLKTMFEQHLQNEVITLTVLGIVSLIFIVAVILFIGKDKPLIAINFLIFPSAMIFLYFTSIEINILHLFMFFIILAICIDYGIYLSKSHDNQTKKAIIFSALSSFAGFGVLVFSSTASLFSIGIVATIGIIAILILIFLKADNVS